LRKSDRVGRRGLSEPREDFPRLPTYAILWLYLWLYPQLYSRLYPQLYSQLYPQLYSQQVQSNFG
ncbi:MAG: hypothetical protein O3B75_05800, partial [Planctomycetota bacterium]|nr:hypothetical protein [Planctomycetota bacterium]